jgi:fructoselysine-6-P-deglycase FrlB-like protein
MQLEGLVEKAKQSALFTAPRLEEDLARFLKDQGAAVAGLARSAREREVRHVYWVGSGNSWTNLYSGKQLLDRFSDLPSDCMPSYDLIWRQPRRLDEHSLAIFSSYSGATEDTLNAFRYANQRGAWTVAIVDKEDSPMGREAREVLPFHSTGLYALPLAAACLFSLEYAKLGGADVQRTIDAVYALPPVLGKAYREDEARAKQLAEEYKDEDLFYVLASGPLYGLGYKYGLTVFMENMRVHGSFIETSEFRHGPVEMLEKKRPAMVFLMGTDESRSMSHRVLDVATSARAKTIVYDFADYGGLDPLVAPFVLHVPLQWFAVYSALLRGVTDLDERVMMGKGKLATGQGVTWP